MSAKLHHSAIKSLVERSRTSTSVRTLAPQASASAIPPRREISAQERDRTSTPVKVLVPKTSAAAITPLGQVLQTKRFHKPCMSN